MKLTISEYNEHRNDYDGYCVGCKTIGRYGYTEPDAENYECDECGENKAMGMDNALIMGYLEIED